MSVRLLIDDAAVAELAEHPQQAARLFERLRAWKATSGQVLHGAGAALPEGYVHLLWMDAAQRTGELGIDPEGQVSS